MNTLEFMSHLRELGIEVEPNGERLRITAPSKALTPALRNQLRERKAELLIFLRQASGLDMPQPLPRNKEGVPLERPQLSLSQQTWQFVDKLTNQAKSAANIQAAWLLTGELDFSQLEEAIRQIVRRHDSWRTNIVVENEQSYQQIHPATDVKLSIIDLQDLPEEQALSQIERFTLEEATSSFDLQSEILLRPLLWRISNKKNVLLLTCAHMITDHWSMTLFMRELVQFYMGKEPPPLLFQDTDYADWQRTSLTDQILKNSLNYWQEQLTALSPLLELPYDHPRPRLPSQEGRRTPFYLSSELTQKLKLLSQEANATLIMTLLAAFNVLLYRYLISEQQEDILVGIPITLRKAQAEASMGNFFNILILRSKLEESLSFSDLLKQVRQNALDAYTHQEVPFYKVIEALQREGGEREAEAPTLPLIQVLFKWQPKRISHFELPTLSIKPFHLEKITTNYELSLEIEEQESILAGYFEYRTDLFEPATIQRMVDHFITLLKGIVANPQQSISKLPLLTFEEQYKVLVEWNQTEMPYPHDATIHQLFEEQVERTPNNIAVVCEGKSLTYQALNQRANQLAHYLQRVGIGPDIYVGICMERSLEMVTAMLGILKAGAAYLPLDPNYPQERLSFMVENARLSFLLTQERLLGIIPGTSKHGETSILHSTTGKRYLAPLVLCLDRDWSLIAQEKRNNPITHVTSDNLAYLIYTSGSTAQPKGVLIRHQGLVNLSLAVASRYGLKETDRVLQFSPLSFDVAGEECYPTWLKGGTVVLCPDERQRSIKRFRQLIEEEELTVLNLPSSYWHEWVHELSHTKQALPTCLRLMIVGSEQVCPERVGDWLGLPGAAQVRWFNAYGLSESTITATTYELPPIESKVVEEKDQVDYNLQNHRKLISSRIPIGHPIANTKVYILDKQLQPVPIGVPGELYIGGDGLARGYLAAPALSRERFISNPFADSLTLSRQGKASTPNRLYKTGDLVRYLSNGKIDFLRRMDHQVKIQGIRIEPAEIEARLLEHPVVNEGAVIMRQSEELPEDKYLAAYFTAKQGGLPTKKQWQLFFLQKLPNIMVPAVVVPLEKLPRLPNGQVDYQALPAPAKAANDDLMAPQSPIEQKILEIWREILPTNNRNSALEQISIHDNFFTIGGNYLLATKVLSRLHETFQVKFSLRELFEAPTIAEQAEQLQTIEWVTQSLTSHPSMDNREEFEL